MSTWMHRRTPKVFVWKILETSSMSCSSRGAVAAIPATSIEISTRSLRSKPQKSTLGDDDKRDELYIGLIEVCEIRHESRTSRGRNILIWTLGNTSSPGWWNSYCKLLKRNCLAVLAAELTSIANQQVDLARPGLNLLHSSFAILCARDIHQYGDNPTWLQIIHCTYPAR